MEEQGLQFFLASLVVFLFGIGLFLMGYITQRKRLKIFREGEETIATIVSKEKVFQERKYQYILAYTTKEGRNIRVKSNEMHSLPYIKKHPVGSTLDIKYLPEDARKYVIMNSPRMNIGLTIMMLAGVGLIMFSVFIIYSAFKEGAF